MNDQDNQRYEREQGRIVSDMDAACERLERLHTVLQDDLPTASPAKEAYLATVEDTIARVSDARDAVQSAVESLPGVETTAERKQLALRATTAVSTAHADVTALEAGPVELDEPDNEDQAAGPAQGKGKLKQFIDNHIKPLLTKVASRLWAIISHLLTPKEWQITGEVSGGIPALGMAKVELAITFGA